MPYCFTDPGESVLLPQYRSTRLLPRPGCQAFCKYLQPGEFLFNSRVRIAPKFQLPIIIASSIAHAGRSPSSKNRVRKTFAAKISCFQVSECYYTSTSSRGDQYFDPTRHRRRCYLDCYFTHRSRAVQRCQCGTSFAHLSRRTSDDGGHERRYSYGGPCLRRRRLLLNRWHQRCPSTTHRHRRTSADGESEYRQIDGGLCFRRRYECGLRLRRRQPRQSLRLHCCLQRLARIVPGTHSHFLELAGGGSSSFTRARTLSLARRIITSRGNNHEHHPRLLAFSCLMFRLRGNVRT